MRRRDAKLLGWLVLLTCGFGRSLVLWADDTESPAAPIQFRIVADRDSFPAEQGVWLTVTATNVSENPATFVWGDYPYDDLFEFEVVRPDGVVTPPPRRRLCPPVEALTARDIVTLAPGETRERTIVLATMFGGNVQTFRFLYPGTYLIRSRIKLMPVRPAADGSDFFESASAPIDIACEDLEVAVQAPVPDPTLFFSMTGQVVDSDGDPIASVEIDVEAQHQGFSSINGVSWLRIDRVVTDRRGRFAIEGLDRSVARYRLLLHHPEHPVVGQEIPTRTNEGIIELDPMTLADGHPLEGLVTDDQGTPIVGARVTTGVDREQWTDRDGRFRDNGFHTALAELDAPPQLQAWKRGWVEAGLPQIEETNGELLWHQMLVPESQQQISGVARFTGGEVAGNMDLYVYRDPSDGYPIESTTDAAGRFTVDWPEYPGQSNHGVVALLERGEYHVPRRAWTSTFDDLTAGQSGIEFVFDASRQLELNVVPSNELPDSVTLTVNVSLKTAGNREQRLFEEHLPSTGGALSWDRLSPGSYLVTVRVDRAEHWNWTQEVVIAANEGTPANCRVELPELQFGSATLNVVSSAGNPWSGGDLWMDSSHGWGPVSVFNGEAELRDVPAGPIHIEVHSEGYARTHLHGEIVAGETVDLGTLKALTLEEGTGLVVGRVMLAGGSPALGARVEVDGGSYALPPHLGGQQVDGDGLFELRLDPGRQTIRVGFDAFLDSEFNALNDVSASGGFLMHSQRRLNKVVDVVAGEETQIEITIPLLDGEVEIQGAMQSALLYLPLDDTTTFEDTTGWHDPSIQATTFRRLPHSLAQVVVSRALPDSVFPDSQGYRHVWEHHWAEVSSAPSIIELEDLHAGRLLASVRGPSGEPITQFTLKAAPLYDCLPDNVRNARNREQIQPTGVGVEDEVGVLYLVPGRYEVSIAAMGQTVLREVEVVDGQTVEINFDLAAD